MKSRLGVTTFSLIVILAAFLTPPSHAQTAEVIVTNSNMSNKDTRFEYYKAVMEAALKRAYGEDRKFQLEPYPSLISRNRTLEELIRGTMTVFGAPTRREWEERAIPIRIPIRKGLLGYRLFLIEDGREDLFKRVKTIEDLKKLRVGAGAQWTTTKALRRHGFEVTGGNDYEGLFTMLSFGRFDFFPRGITEIFSEYDSRKDKFPTMRIEKNLALYMPLPTYFFVTPKRPDLALKLEQGLQKMVEDGSLDKIFFEFYGDFIERANMKKRRVLTLSNPFLTKETPFDRKEYWYQP